VNCVRFSPDGNKLLTVSSDKTGHLYDGKTGDYIKPLSSTNAHTAGVYSCSWSPDSKQVLTASADKTCKIWDGETGECLKTFTFGDNPPVELQMLGSLWQGDTLISVALSGDVYYLDVNAPNRPLRVVRGHNKIITALAYDSANRSLYSGSYDAAVVQWDAASGATEPFHAGHSNQINAIHVQGNNLVTAAMDDTVRITPFPGSASGDNAVKLDSTPVDIAVGKRDHSLIVAVITDAVVLIKNKHVASKFAVKYQPLTVALSVDETQVAVGGKDNNIYVYNLSGNTLSEAAVLKGHRGALSSLAYSPDGQHLASSDTNREIFVWDKKSNQIKIQGWVFHTARVNCVAWSPDSVHVASAGLDGNIFVWSVEKTDKRVHIRDAHRGGVNSVVFLDDHTIASAGQDCAIKTWTITHH